MRSKKARTLDLRRRFAIGVLVTGLALVSTAAGASAASTAESPPSGGARVAAALAFDLNGPWTDNGTAKPIVTVVNSTVLIDMSFAHRPNGVGSVIGSNSILVRFPDADTYIGTLESPTLLRWSNGSTWQKVFTGATVIDLNQVWTDSIRQLPMSVSNGFITVNMRDAHRPNAVGFVGSASTISVSFPDAGAYTATLQDRVGSPDVLQWSNGSQWSVFVDPGTPGCLILC